MLLDRVFGYHHQYAVFYIAVLWAAWYAGFGPSVLAIVLGGIAVIALAASSPFWKGDAGGGLVGFEFYFIVAFTGAILLKAQQTAHRKAVWNARVASDRLRRLESETEQRKSAQEEVSQTQQQFRLAFEHAPVGICQVAPDGSIGEVNPELCRILGRPREDLVQHAFAEVIFPDGADAVQDYRRVLEGSIDSHYDQIRYTRKDGTAIWAGIYLAGVRSTTGRSSYAIAVVEDITARKRAEDQLRETQKLESIALLAGGIAHDFNNLLTSVLGNATLAMDTIPADSTARQMLDGVLTAAQRAAALTAQLLAYAGKGAFLPHALDMSKAARQVSDLLRLTIPPTIALRLELEAGAPPIRADASQIQQLITNLVLNATDAIGEDTPGAVTIRTGSAQFDESPADLDANVGEIHAGRYVTLSVEDTGAGIEKSILPRIFEPFFTTKFMGRGLGLAAVAGIVRSQKGAIVVSSSPGQGSRFQVLFPVAPAAALLSEQRPKTVTRGLSKGSGTG
jgi:PAS domain S-box-containing protein